LAKTVVNGCTEAEALTALAKARAMIDAYEIGDEELALTREEKALIREDIRDDPHEIKRFLGQAVARFAGVEIWRQRDGYRSRTGRMIFCGLQSDVDLAEWLLNHLAGFVLYELMAPRGQRRSIVNGFVLGCCGRISARLDALTRESRMREERRSATDTSPAFARALVLADIKREAIKGTMAAAGIRLTSTTTRRKSDPNARGAGAMAGDRATFGPTWSGRGGSTYRWNAG
jgi:hypothetical protein